MPTRSESRSRLVRYFKRSPVADLVTLKRLLQTTSRTTVFRVLSEVGYRTSCSHAGCYYTLEHVPRFDSDGLWFHEGALFSQHGTLRATIVHFVEVTPAGRTHAELRARLQLRVHDTLRDLTKAGEIGRLRIERIFLYVAIDPATAEAQVVERKRLPQVPPPSQPPGPAVVIEVLVEIIHNARVRGDPPAIVTQLAARGIHVTDPQVEVILGEHGIGKKGARSRSRRLRR